MDTTQRMPGKGSSPRRETPVHVKLRAVLRLIGGENPAIVARDAGASEKEVHAWQECVVSLFRR